MSVWTRVSGMSNRRPAPRWSPVSRRRLRRADATSWHGTAGPGEPHVLATTLIFLVSPPIYYARIARNSRLPSLVCLPQPALAACLGTNSSPPYLARIIHRAVFISLTRVRPRVNRDTRERGTRQRCVNAISDRDTNTLLQTTTRRTYDVSAILLPGERLRVRGNNISSVCTNLPYGKIHVGDLRANDLFICGCNKVQLG